MQNINEKIYNDVVVDISIQTANKIYISDKIVIEINNGKITKIYEE